MAVGKSRPFLHIARLEQMVCDDRLGGFGPYYF